MYKCDRCGKIESGSALDIGFDLEDAGMECPCGGHWKRVPRDECPVCGGELEISDAIDNPNKEVYKCPNYPHCPTLGSRDKMV